MGLLADVIVILLASTASVAITADDPVLTVGRGIDGRIPDPSERVDGEEAHVFIPLAIGLSGWVTIDVESPDFDVALSVFESEDTESYWGDDSGGNGPAARLELLAHADKPYTVRVHAEDGLGGTFRLRARSGRALDEGYEDEPRELADFYVRAAQRAQVAGRSRHAQDCWQRAGRLYFFELDDPDAARFPFQQVARLASLNGDDEGAVLARYVLAELHARSWDLEAAALGFASAASDAARIGEADLELDALRSLRAVQEELGRAEAEAESLARLVELTREDALGYEHARASGRLAILAQDRGDPRGALQFHERSLLKLRDSEASADQGAEVCLLAGRLRLERGEPGMAQRFLEQALALEPSPPVELRVLGELALTQLAQGRYARGRGLLERFQRTAARPGADPNSTGVLSVRAVFAARAGELESAAELYQLLLARLPSGAFVHRVEVLGSLANVLEAGGRPEEARAQLEHAVVLAEQAGLERHLGRCRVELGRLLVNMGEADAGAELALLALAAAKERSDEQGVASAQSALGLAFFARGENDEARPLLEAAVPSLLDLGRVQDAMRPLETLALSAQSMGRGDLLAERLRLAEELFDSMPQIRTTGLDHPPSPTRWSALSQDLTALSLARAGAPEVEAAVVLQGFAAAGRWKDRAILGSLGDELAPRQELGALLDELSAMLGPDQVLIEYVEGLERQYAYVLSGKQLRFVDLGLLAELESDVRTFVAGLSARRQLASAEAIASAGADLYERLLAPLMSRVDPGTTGLVIVPSRRLAELPIEALVVGVQPPVDGGPRESLLSFRELRFVADDYLITYGPSTGALAELAARAPRSGPDRTLLVGGVAPASSGRTEVLDAARRLLRTREEVASRHATELQQLANTPKGGSLSTPDFDLYVGQSATAERLRRVSDYAVVHVSALGRVAGDDPIKSRLELAGPGEVELFSLSDVLEMELDADLVLLSSVEGGAEPVSRGKGVQSIADAFVRAGARHVIASRWRTLGQQTPVDLVSGFYEQRTAGAQGATQALRRTRLSLRAGVDERSVQLANGEQQSVSAGHPHFWAGFVHVGVVR